jgi:hypothetical protein
MDFSETVLPSRRWVCFCFRFLSKFQLTDFATFFKVWSGSIEFCFDDAGTVACFVRPIIWQLGTWALLTLVMVTFLHGTNFGFPEFLARMNTLRKPVFVGVQSAFPFRFDKLFVAIEIVDLWSSHLRIQNWPQLNDFANQNMRVPSFCRCLV